MTKLLSMPLFLTICFTSVPSFAIGWEDEDLSDVHTGQSNTAKGDGVAPAASAPKMCIDWFSDTTKLDLSIEQALIQLDATIPMKDIHKLLFDNQAPALIPPNFENYNATNLENNINLILEYAKKRQLSVKPIRELQEAIEKKIKVYSEATDSSCRTYSAAQLKASASKNSNSFLNSLNPTIIDPRETQTQVDKWVKEKERELSKAKQNSNHYQTQLLKEEISLTLERLANPNYVLAIDKEYATLGARALKEQIVQNSQTPLLDKFTGNDIITPFNPANAGMGSQYSGANGPGMGVGPDGRLFGGWGMGGLPYYYNPQFNVAPEVEESRRRRTEALLDSLSEDSNTF